MKLQQVVRQRDQCPLAPRFGYPAQAQAVAAAGFDLAEYRLADRMMPDVQRVPGGGAGLIHRRLERADRGQRFLRGGRFDRVRGARVTVQPNSLLL